MLDEAKVNQPAKFFAAYRIDAFPGVQFPKGVAGYYDEKAKLPN